MRARGVHVERVDPREGVDHGVHPDGAHELADQRVADVELQVVGAAEVVPRLADVDADDFGDVWVFDQALHYERAPPARDPGDEHTSLLRHPYLSMSA